MTLTKITRIQWEHPADNMQELRRNVEGMIYAIQMELQGKTKHYLLKQIDSNTFERLFVDQESAEENIRIQQYLADKYGGKIVSSSIRDIDTPVEM